MTILSVLALLVVASLVTLSLVVLAEAGLMLAHVLAKRSRPHTVTDRNGSGQAHQTR